MSDTSRDETDAQYEAFSDLDTPLGAISPAQVQALRDAGCTCPTDAVVHRLECPLPTKRPPRHELCASGQRLYEWWENGGGR